MTAEFEVGAPAQASGLADELFAHGDVLTVRVGGPEERSVYRVDVPRGHVGARALAVDPATGAARRLGLGVRFVRVAITSDGLGDPEGEPPAADSLPWAARRGHDDGQARP